MARNLTDDEKERIVRLYESGWSYKEIEQKYGHRYRTVSSLVKSRSISDGLKLARSKGRGLVSDEGRKKLSDAGKKAVRTNKKFWTKPEREFIDILHNMGIGVRYPEYISDLFNVIGDDDWSICYQYPIQRYVCDFVDPKRKVVYRINGDYWHANPILYKEGELTDIQKHNVKQDRNCRIFLEKRGWSVVDIWESEIYWHKERVKIIVGRMAQSGSASILHVEGPEFDSQYDHQNTDDWSDKLRKLWFKEPREKKKKEFKICCREGCEEKFIAACNKQQYCSVECRGIAYRRVQRPSKDVLEKEIASESFLSLGRKYGVSDNAIRKWAKSYGIL